MYYENIIKMFFNTYNSMRFYVCYLFVGVGKWSRWVDLGCINYFCYYCVLWIYFGRVLDGIGTKVEKNIHLIDIYIEWCNTSFYDCNCILQLRSKIKPVGNH